MAQAAIIDTAAYTRAIVVLKQPDCEAIIIAILSILVHKVQFLIHGRALLTFILQDL